jgi:MFS family permease
MNAEPDSKASGVTGHGGPANPMADVWAIIGAQTILQLAGGLIAVWLPLAMAGHDFSNADIGLVASAHGIGFMAGAWIAPRVLGKLGPFRTYAAAGALASALTLSLYASDATGFWAVSRLLAGVALALVFASADGWLAASVPQARRGEVTGLYMLCTKITLALGPVLLGVFAGGEGPMVGPLIVAAGCMSLAMVPVAFTGATPSAVRVTQRLGPKALYQTAPAAFVAAFGAGFMNTSILTFAPLYAREIGGEAAVPSFIAAAWVGSLLVQWHAGKLSDRVDRRLVLAGLVALPALIGWILVLFGDGMGIGLATLLFAFWGAGALSFYGIAVAHLGDRLPREQVASGTAGLLFVWSAGMVVGPLVAGGLMQWADSAGAVFWFAALCGSIMVPWFFVRTTIRPAAAPADKVGFGPIPTSSVMLPDMMMREKPSSQGPVAASKKATPEDGAA